MAVMAAYYDFIPTMHQAKKVFWIQLRDPPPSSLKFGTLVKLGALDPNLGLPLQSLQVVDIIGTRVVLQPLSIPESDRPKYSSIIPFQPGNQKRSDKKWHPLDHDFHWAYALKDWATTVNTAKNWTYGSGESVAYIIW